MLEHYDSAKWVRPWFHTCINILIDEENGEHSRQQWKSDCKFSTKRSLAIRFSYYEGQNLHKHIKKLARCHALSIQHG